MSRDEVRHGCYVELSLGLSRSGRTRSGLVRAAVVSDQVFERGKDADFLASLLFFERDSVAKKDLTVRREKELSDLYCRYKTLQPERVVAFARNPRTALHSSFEWDNTRAAQLYRLEQARHLIRTVVHIEPRVNKVIQTYVSVPSRRRNGLGFTRTIEALSDAQMRAELLNEALEDLNAFLTKYKSLKELAKLFSKLRAATCCIRCKLKKAKSRAKKRTAKRKGA